jgi:hypothetical protein
MMAEDETVAKSGPGMVNEEQGGKGSKVSYHIKKSITAGCCIVSCDGLHAISFEDAQGCG